MGQEPAPQFNEPRFHNQKGNRLQLASAHAIGSSPYFFWAYVVLFCAVQRIIVNYPAMFPSIYEPVNWLNAPTTDPGLSKLSSDMSLREQ